MEMELSFKGVLGGAHRGKQGRQSFIEVSFPRKKFSMSFITHKLFRPKDEAPFYAEIKEPMIVINSSDKKINLSLESLIKYCDNIESLKEVLQQNINTNNNELCISYSPEDKLQLKAENRAYENILKLIS